MSTYMSRESMNDKLNFIGKALRNLYIAKFYHNGDGAGFIWNWFNPLSWIVSPLLFIIYIFVEGYPKTIKNKHDIGFGMDPYFVEHPDEIEWD